MRQFILSAMLGLYCLMPAAMAGSNTLNNNLLGQYAVSTHRELGTALELTRDGRFQWSLIYGDGDHYVGGTWQVTGKQLLLTADPQAPLRIRLAQAEEAKPVWLPKTGFWVVLIGGAGRASLPPMDIEFLAESGASARGATTERGDAAVQMPIEQAWASVKVRRGGSGDAWLVLPVSKAVADRRLGVLVIENLEAIFPPFFTTLALQIRDRDLVPVEDGALAGMVYERITRSSAKSKRGVVQRTTIPSRKPKI